MLSLKRRSATSGVALLLTIGLYAALVGYGVGGAGAAPAAAQELRSASGDDAAAPEDYLWVDPAELKEFPMKGAEWDRLLGEAARVTGTADVSDQNSEHDVFTLAAALVAVRTGDPKWRAAALDGLRRAAGTEQGGRWLAVGRNLASYAIAADLLDVRSGPVHEWIVGFLDPTFRLPHNNSGEPIPFIPFNSGSNASAQEGFAYAAAAAYAGDRRALRRAWDAFRTYAGDPTAPDREDIDLSKGIEYGWSHVPAKAAGAVAVNPLGAAKGEVRLDGAIINDMRRGGRFAHPPGHTQYPWVGLEGFVPAALVLERAGYPAFEVADRAVLRAVEYLWWLHEDVDQYWWDAGSRRSRAAAVKHLINWRYGTDFPHGVTRGGRTVGYTAWTHPR